MNCIIYIFLKNLIAMDPVTLIAIFLFCDFDHNVLKKGENLYMSAYVLQVKINAQQQAFGKVQASQKKVFMMSRFVF